MTEAQKIRDAFKVSTEGIIIAPKNVTDVPTEDNLFKGKPLHTPYFFKRMKKELEKWITNKPLDNSTITCNEHLRKIIQSFVIDGKLKFDYLKPIDSSNALVVNMKISLQEFHEFPDLIGDSITIKLAKGYWNFYVCIKDTNYDETEWFLVSSEPKLKSHGDIIARGTKNGRRLSEYLTRKLNFQANIAKEERRKQIQDEHTK